jgi:hypothetical protein
MKQMAKIQEDEAAATITYHLERLIVDLSKALDESIFIVECLVSVSAKLDPVYGVMPSRLEKDSL